MKEKLKSFIFNKEVKNAGWIIAGKVMQMILSFLVSIWSLRYFGPSDNGLINYVNAYVSFFYSFCTLGLTSSILIQEMTESPEEEGKIIGTSIGMRLLSSFLSACFIVFIVSRVDKGEKETIVIAIISSFSMLFQVVDTIEYWFQKRYMSKITSIATFAGYCISLIFKIILLANKASVEQYVLTSTVDFLAVAVFLLTAYKKYNGPKLRFSWEKAKELLKKGYHFILSGMMVAVYAYSDKLMLKHLLSQTDVGYYSLAANLSTIWVFVLSAIISSLAPSIVQFKKDGDEEAYRKKNRQLYGIVFYLSLIVSIGFTVLAPFIIPFLYGDQYLGSVNPLRVITWYVAFSYLGVARDQWLVCENKQKYSKYMYIVAALTNVVLNYIFIPVWGATGAAMTSLVTQVMTCMVIPVFFREIRPNVKLMIEGILLVDYRKKKGEISQ